MFYSYTIYIDFGWEKEYGYQLYNYLKFPKCKVFIEDKKHCKLVEKRLLKRDIVVVDNNTGNFFTINHHDKYHNISRPLVSNPKCICVFKCQYRYNEKSQFKDKISPFTYTVKYHKIYSIYQESYLNKTNNLLNTTKLDNLMFFKGNENKKNRSLILKKLSQFGIVNKDYGYSNSEKIIFQKYLSRLTSSKLVLSLPGAGNFCHREIEAFGLGVPVIMPILKNSYYDNLIPNVHYIPIDYSYDHESDEISEEKANEYTKAIKEKYEQVINDENLLKTISKNAFNWFNKNVKHPSAAKIIHKVLLEKYNYNLFK